MNMKDKRHIQSATEFNENLNISDVSDSLEKEIKKLNEHTKQLLLYGARNTGTFIEGWHLMQEE